MSTQTKENSIPYQPTNSMDIHFHSIIEEFVKAVQPEFLTTSKENFFSFLKIKIQTSQASHKDFINLVWDLFYDWILFEQFSITSPLLTHAPQLLSKIEFLHKHSYHSLFSIQKKDTLEVVAKCLFTSNKYKILSHNAHEFIGTTKHDLIHARIYSVPLHDKEGISLHPSKKTYTLLRAMNFFPKDSHSYLIKKTKLLKKQKNNVEFYQFWLWNALGMYIKHLLYPSIGIENIFNDTSRI